MLLRARGVMAHSSHLGEPPADRRFDGDLVAIEQTRLELADLAVDPGAQGMQTKLLVNGKGEVEALLPPQGAHLPLRGVDLDRSRRQAQTSQYQKPTPFGRTPSTLRSRRDGTQSGGQYPPG